MRILIVDDQPSSASVLERALRTYPFPTEIIRTQNKEEALARVSEYPVQVVITNFVLSDSNGLDLIDKVQAAQPEAPAPYKVLIADYDAPGLEVSARRLKVNQYLIRPYALERLRSSIQDHFSSDSPVQSSNQPQVRQRQFKVLVADDYSDNVHLLVTRLQSEGLGYTTAADGEQTLQKLREEKPDLLLLDINMPGKDGFQVLNEMRADPELAKIPTIIITAARISPKDVRDGLDMGADDYVTKPIDWRELSARIQTKLRAKQAREDLERRNLLLNVLPHITHAMREEQKPDVLLKQALRETSDALKTEQGHLFLLKGLETIRYISSSPADFAAAPAEEASRFIFGLPAAQKALADRRCFVLDDLSQEANWPVFLGGAQGSAALVPVVGMREQYGMLLFTHGQATYFQVEHTGLLEAIARQMAMALENLDSPVPAGHNLVKLLAIRRISTALDDFIDKDRLLNELPDLLRQELGYNLASVWLSKPGGIEISVQSPADQDLPKCLIEAAQAAVEQMRVARSISAEGDLAIGVPLKWKAQAEAALAIFQTANGDGESDVLVMETLGKLINSTLERIWLSQTAAKEHQNLLRILNGVADHVQQLAHSATPDPDNPFYVINQSTRMLAQAGSLNDSQQQALQKLQWAVAYMEELMIGLVEVGRLELGIRPAQDLFSMGDLLAEIENTLRPQANEKGLRVILQVEHDTAPTLGDRIRLGQALEQLFGTALEMSPAGQTLLVKSSKEADRLRVEFASAAPLSPSQMQPVPGLNISLALVKSILERHEGGLEFNPHNTGQPIFRAWIQTSGEVDPSANSLSKASDE